MMNIFFAGLNTGVGITPSPVAPVPISTRIRVLIISGQSNARGQQNKTTIPTFSHLTNSPLSGCKIWNGSSFVDIEADVNTNWPAPNTYFGAELNYAYLTQNFFADGSIDYVIKWGQNASDISKWMEGGVFYTPFTTWVINALAAISGNSNNYSVVFYWDQGENDATNPFSQIYTAGYEDRFTEMITGYRALFNVRKMPVIIRKHRYDVGASFPNIATLIQQQNNIIQNVPDTYLIPCDDLMLFDGIHLNGPSQCEMGKRVMQKAIYLFD